MPQGAPKLLEPKSAPKALQVRRVVKNCYEGFWVELAESFCALLSAQKESPGTLHFHQYAGRVAFAFHDLFSVLVLSRFRIKGVGLRVQ